MRHLKLASALLMVMGGTAANAAQVYFNDFSTGAAGFSGSDSVLTAPGNNEKFLGALTQGQTATLSLSGLASHSTVTLTFDLYALQSLDGSNTGVGPDYFTLKQNGSSVLFNETFATHSGWPQSYGNGGSGTVAGGTGSDPALTGVLGYTFWGPDHTYHLSFTIADSASNIAFNFIGNSDQVWNDEGFGVDNVRVSINSVANNGVPLPSTLSLLALAGLGLGRFVRRR